jgi:hypothetical protein
MGTKFTLTEQEREDIKKQYQYLIKESDDKKDDRKFCHGGNVKTLEEIVGDDTMEDYI